MSSTVFSTALPNLAIAKLGLGVVTSSSQPNPVDIDEGTAGFIPVSGGPGGFDTWQDPGAVIFPSITGDISISSSGVSVINSGVIVNSMVSPSAAIEYSKLSLTSSVVNADISPTAAIAYSKLNLTSSVVNTDVSPTAAIAYSKLNLTSSVVNTDIAPAAGIQYSKLNLTSSVINADISPSAAIAYSKLNLTSSVVNADIAPAAAIVYSKLDLTSSVVNADIAPAAAIAYSKLNLTSSVVNADISPTAAIAGSKVSPNFGSQAISTTGSLSTSAATFAGTVNITAQNEFRFQDSAGEEYVGLRAAATTTTHTLTLPGAAPTAGQMLVGGTSTATDLAWKSPIISVLGTDTTGLTDGTFTDVTGASITVIPGETYWINYGGVGSVTNSVAPAAIQVEFTVNTSSNTLVSQTSRGTSASLISATISRGSFAAGFSYLVAAGITTLKVRCAITVTGGTITTRDARNVFMCAHRIS